MKSVDMKRMLELTRDKVRNMPEPVYMFTKYLVSKLKVIPTPEDVATAISLSLSDIKHDDTHSVPQVLAEYLTDNKQEVLDNAKFVLQVIDDLTENAKFLAGETEDFAMDDFADKVRDLCTDTFDRMPVQRAKIYDRKLLHALYDPCVMVAVEWWTTAIQLVDEGGLAGTNPRITRLDTGVMFRIRDALASKIDWSLEKNGFAVLSTRGGPDSFLHVFEDYEVDPFCIPDAVTMCVFEDKVVISRGNDIDYKCIWA